MAEPPFTDRPRRGRPRSEDRGLVDERVLDAATALFLEQGFGRTTLDQVSERSRTGKSTLYGRYANKEELFAAVVKRSIDAMFDDLKAAPVQGSVESRLRHIGHELARVMLDARCVALMRITAAEAGKFPALATLGYQMSFDGTARFVADAIIGPNRTTSIASVLPTACRFVELALQPISFQATFGVDPQLLKDQVSRHIEEAIVLLTATGLLKG
ncbi:MAG: TetR/AcrR family transcriptional regulator [Sphingobium sp.]|uniref:TetR/AcrR family transcriptional regulator n=1 Tax=Sphingobium sp. TaxID=1912891 RepID=UPI0029A45C6E|nr:TetR/AcrR family transcriptional regulator [Sphingobium sp.]MDX3910400.1 TetR/AcrR family transcriptional regulator [Sphingobium sp.]